MGLLIAVPQVDPALSPPKSSAKQITGVSVNSPSPPTTSTSPPADEPSPHSRSQTACDVRETLPAVDADDVTRVVPDASRGRSLVPPRRNHRPDVIPRPAMPGSLHQVPTSMVLPVLGIDPCTREGPDECSDGTKPTNDPMVKAGESIPVTDFHGPREPGQGGHPSQTTHPADGGTNSLSAAISSIAVLRRRRRDCIVSTCS